MNYNNPSKGQIVAGVALSASLPGAAAPAGDGGANDRHFRTDHLLANLKGRTVSSGFITMTSQGVQFALTLASTMVLARLLIPRDFGLLAMVFTIMGFLRVFKEAGLSTATVQREGITHAQVSNLFWINVAVSGLVGVLVAAMAPVIAWFFREPPLVGVTLALSISFLLAGLAVQHTALLNRQMRFKAIAIIQIGSVLAGVLAGISMAWQGCGYWSLVGLNLTTSVVALLLTWWSCRWRPNLFKRHSGTRSLIGFGANLTAGSFLYSVARGLDGLLIGRFWGAHPLGLYSRAGAMLSRPLEQFVSPIEAVFLPAFSRLQTHPERYRRTFLQVFETVALVSFLFTGMCFGLAHPLTLVVLGPKWEKAALIFAALSFAALQFPLGSCASWLLTSQGRGRESFFAGWIISIIVAGSFIAGLPFGPLGVAVAYSASCLLIQTPVYYWLAGRSGPVSTGDLWIGLLKHLPVWVIVTVVAWLTRTAVLNFSPLAQLAICIPASLLAGGAFVFVYSPSRRVAANLFSLLQELKNPAGNSCPPSSLRSEMRDIASAERLVQPMTSRFDSSAARKVESEIPTATMKITVILCTYNRCGQLGTVLECISNQRLPESVQWEVLVVDNNSRDETRKVVETFSDRHPGRFRYLFEAQQGKSYALNTGIREASGDILVFIDDDVMVEPMWLRNLTAALNTDGCAGIGGRVLPERAFSPPDWLSLDSGKIEGPLVIFDRGDVAGKLQEAPVGTNMAFHKKMFEKYGGFRTDMGPSRNSEIRGEDSEFGGRLLSKGERLRYEPSAIVYHSVPEERVQRKYFLAWWYDKGRSEVRELGMPPHTRWVIGGIPLYLFRRLAIWGLRWMISVQPARRFICKIEVWSVAGRIVEFHRRAKRLRNGE